MSNRRIIQGIEPAKGFRPAPSVSAKEEKFWLSRIAAPIVCAGESAFAMTIDKEGVNSFADAGKQMRLKPLIEAGVGGENDGRGASQATSCSASNHPPDQFTILPLHAGHPDCGRTYGLASGRSRLRSDPPLDRKVRSLIRSEPKALLTFADGPAACSEIRV